MNDYFNYQTKYAEQIYENGFQSDNYMLELKLLAVYMRDNLGYKPKKREEELTNFCKENIHGFRMNRDYFYITQPLSYSKDKRHKLIDFDDINIYQSEIDFIDNQDVSYNTKKVMFTLLVEHKKSEKRYKITNGEEYHNNWWGGTSKKYTYLKKISKIPTNYDINYQIFYELIQAGLANNAIEGMVILNFLDDITTDGEVIYNITDFENVGWYYDLYHNENKVKQCKQCGKLFKQTGKFQLYCTDCSIVVDREKAKDRMRKIRNN